MTKQLDIRINKRYQLVAKLGEGTFGLVYQGLDLQTNDEVAIKLENSSTYPSILAGEISIYDELRGGLGIPELYWSGHDCEYRVMVFELLGPNLEDLFNYCGRCFSPKTVLLLADQLLHRLQFLHMHNVTHRDIKPENILMGRGRKGSKVYITDLGLAWSDHGSVAKKSNGLLGTARYASINGHLGNEQSAYDDLESLGYMLIYFLNGALPWQGLGAQDRKEKDRLILDKKQTTSPSALCHSLPEVFAEYMSYVRDRKAHKPDYAKLRTAFGSYFRQQGFEYDHVYDWTILKYLACHDE